jgi:hypothetical protein
MQGEMGGVCGRLRRGEKHTQCFGRKPKWKGPLKRPRHRWEDTI